MEAEVACNPNSFLRSREVLRFGANSACQRRSSRECKKQLSHISLRGALRVAMMGDFGPFR
jgi:hypothetical protein